MEWKKENKEEIVSNWNKEWTKVNGSTKKMFWEGKWYKEVGGKLVKIR